MPPRGAIGPPLDKAGLQGVPVRVVVRSKGERTLRIFW